MNRRTITALDVARVVGVHPSTVSRSLDPTKKDQVKRSTRERVELAASELGYRPNLTASSLRRRNSKTIGVLVSSFSNPIYGELLHGISDELERLGYHVLIAEVPDEPGDDRMSVAIDMLQSRRIDGLICAASRGRDAAVLRALAESGLPVVLCLRWIEATGIPRVVNNDALGGALAARHLLELGHREIIEITGPTDISTFAERERGFGDVLDSATGPIVRRVIRAETPSIDEGFRVMARALEEPTRFTATALFAHNDLLAIGAMDALSQVGIESPQGISVVGYNDNPLTGHLKPALTTIRLHIDRMGREAARAVVGIISESPDVSSELSVVPELIVRESTAPASSSVSPASTQLVPLQRLGSSSTLP